MDSLKSVVNSCNETSNKSLRAHSEANGKVKENEGEKCMKTPTSTSITGQPTQSDTIVVVLDKNDTTDRFNNKTISTVFATNTVATTTATATSINSNSNHETDLEAMSKAIEELPPPSPPSPPTKSSIKTTNTTTTTPTKFSMSNETTATALSLATATTSNQFVTPQKLENKSIPLPPPPPPLQHNSSSSSKKKRNNISKCFGVIGDHRDSATTTNIAAATLSPSSSQSIAAANIKTSLSMTSLPPDEKQDSRDGIKAKLKLERPYNSLKKNADRNLTNQLANMHPLATNHHQSTNNSSSNNNKYNRYSWGSGHSSSSLHSSAATLGIGSGKDDLWAAIQTNYNYIMDTNLLDTCKEARYELEGAVSVLDNTMDKTFKLLDDNNHSVSFCEDPKELRKWLRDMEHKLENAPTLSEATMLTCAELESHLNEHSVLYHEIVSHARVVSACIRAASEKEQQQQKLQQQHRQQQQQPDSYNTDTSLIAEQNNSSLSSTDDTTNSTTNTCSLSTVTTTSGVVCSASANSLSDQQQINPNTITASASSIGAVSGHTQKKSENNSLERLQNRYHLLYLKAFEVQLWLDGLLRKKSSSVGNLTNDDLDSEDIDDSIDYSDDCCLDGRINVNNDDEDGATEDDLNDVASDLESDITHNSLSYNDEDLQSQHFYNKHQQQPSRLQHQHKQHFKKKQQQQQQLKHCHSSDIDENETLNVSSQHHHLQTDAAVTARDCIQTKIDCENVDDDEDEDRLEIEEEAEYGDDEDEIDSPQYRHQFGYTKLLVTFDRSSVRSSASAAQHKTTVTLTDFEADSESSDLETIQSYMGSNLRANNKFSHPNIRYPTSLMSSFIKRPTITNCGSITTPTTIDKLESCEMHGIYETTATQFNNKAQQNYKQQQQILTLMAITQNAMTTGSAIVTETQSLGSSLAASTSSNSNTANSMGGSISSSGGNCSSSGNNSDGMSNISSCDGGGLVNATNNRNINSSDMSSKILLADNENNHQHLQHHQQQHKINAGLALKQKNIAIISPNSHKSYNNKHQHNIIGGGGGGGVNKSNSNSNKSPTVLRKHQHHHHHHHHHHHDHHHSSDISKFNRSNRKSKNCAIFYFKHLDTDNETNYSNSNCDDDSHDDVRHRIAAGLAIEHGGDVCCADGRGRSFGVSVADSVALHTDSIAGGLLSSSAASSSHTSDLLKSADVSSDDDGWMYTSAPLQQQQQQFKTIGGIESLNSNHISNGHSAASNEIHINDSGIQSSAISSSTITTVTAALINSSGEANGLGDDSDKENHESKAAICTSSLTRIHLNRNQTYAANTTVVDSDSGASFNAAQHNSRSSSSVTSSSSSSNDRFTEATTTTTNTTQILMYKQQQNHPSQYRTEMELQINNNNQQQQQLKEEEIIMLNENILSTSLSMANNKSTPATNMPHLAINHSSNNSNNNNNCANSPLSSTTTLSQYKLSNTNNNNYQHNVTATKTSTEDAANGNLEKENINFCTRADICNISVKMPTNHINDNNNHYHYQQQPSTVAPTTATYGQQLLHVNVGKRLPPRSPAKSSLSHASTTTASTSTITPTKGKVSHESIKQLVLEAEHLVRDDQTKQKHSSSSNNSNTNSAGGGNIVQISTTIKKREILMPGTTKRVQEWLEHQPTAPPTTVQVQKSTNHHHNDHLLMATCPTRTDDCEASGEASETDSIPQHCSDTSEVSDSIATCMQTSTNSYGNSTERIGDSAEPIVNAATSNQSLNVKVIKRQQNRRKSERPWSVSCLSQLTTDANQVAAKVNTISNVQSGLASHSISESALDSLSPGRPRVSSSSAVAHVKSYDSKSSLKRRKTRKKKLSYTNCKKSDTNSEDNHHNNNHYYHHLSHHHGSNNTTITNTHPEELLLTPKQSSNLLTQTSEDMTPLQLPEIQQALRQLQSSDSPEQLQVAATATTTLQQHSVNSVMVTSATTVNESEEENHLMRPNFRVGSFTTAYMTNESRLGSLAALATYRNDADQQGEYNTTGTEDHSSFSETAWDNYQEKYNSENYSEGIDSDAARKFFEFGDDYRNFIDSQSDCCSSLSAANNLDSFSPPRMDSLQQNDSKIITQDTIVSSVDHARRRRALELEYERRRKNLEIRRKSCQESLEFHNPKSPAVPLSSSTQALTPKNSERLNFQHKSETATRKLEFGMSHSAQSLRRTSESDTSQRRRKADERRRSSRNLEKCIKLIPATSSSSGDDTDDEKEMRNLLQQSHNRLEDTKALKIRCHLLRPEDYTEIINTCRDNIRCLESVLKGPTSSVLSSQCVTQSKDLLAAWEDLLGWSENAAAARKMQEDMIVLKHSLNRLGKKSSFELLDTEPSIQLAIEALENEKTQLQTYRTSMLKLNASVHSWLTRQERRLQNALVEQQLTEAAAKVSNELLEEKDELAESEQMQMEQKQQLQQQIVQEQIVNTTATAIGNTTTTTMITVTDNNGNQVEKHTTTASTATTNTNTQGTSTSNNTSTITAEQQQQMLHSNSSCSKGSEKSGWDLQTLITSENEFHKHLKGEVSDMYTAWDEADERIKSQLEVLTSSLLAWRQLEYGLSEFQLALGQDRGTLKGLEGALNTGQATPGELAQNVKLVAKLLSEKANVSQEQLTAVQDYLDPNHILSIAKFTASNGSLSDSGISDGGTTSDGGLSERERRLGVLRRLAKQLESALAPGSEAMKSIAARMESAENELKSLQNTCRDLIVRTAASHQNKKQQQQQELSERPEDNDNNVNDTNGALKTNPNQEVNGKLKQLTEGDQTTIANGYYSGQSGNKRNKSRPRRNSNRGENNSNMAVVSADMSQSNAVQMTAAGGDGGDDPSDNSSLAYDLDTSDDELTPKNRKGWGWRIARIAVPMQLALFAVYCAANIMQPNCCDNINNFSMSFTPQLRYIRGPPPI